MSKVTSLFAEFADLFDGRRDVVGLDEGGCFRIEDDATWRQYINAHLDAPNSAIGVYPLVPHWQPSELTWSVKWGCVDFDVRTGAKPAGDYDTEEEAHDAAQALQKVLAVVAGMSSHVEVTRSHGRHVWVFFDDWQPAAAVRRGLIAACNVAQVPTREVNPKAEHYDTEATLGNYVRLPYPHGAADNRYVVSKRDVPLDLTDFTRSAIHSRNGGAELQKLVELYVEPPAPNGKTLVRLADIDIPVVDDALMRRMGGLTYTVFTNGPLEGGDRSSTLFKLGALCFEDKFTPEEALGIITAADADWGKYHNRHDGEHQLERIIERTYQDYEEDDE